MAFKTNIYGRTSKQNKAWNIGQRKPKLVSIAVKLSVTATIPISTRSTQISILWIDNVFGRITVCHYDFDKSHTSELQQNQGGTMISPNSPIQTCIE